MSENLKNKMYNYEVPPPSAAWDAIVAKLGKKSDTKKTKTLYYALAAAASIAVIVFSVFFWTGNRSNNKMEQFVSFMPYNKIPYQLANNYNLKKITSTKKDKQNSLLANNSETKKAQQFAKISKSSNEIIKENNIKTDSNSKTYITIAGPEGQPVKISPKVATLIESSDNRYPPNAVWSSKINKWKDIMKANTLTPTATNYLDIVDLTNTLREIDN